MVGWMDGWMDGLGCCEQACYVGAGGGEVEEGAATALEKAGARQRRGRQERGRQEVVDAFSPPLPGQASPVLCCLDHLTPTAALTATAPRPCNLSASAV